MEPSARRFIAAALSGARERLPQINAESARQARRESLGLGGLALPAEFICPITYDTMRDPVVASDGRSYERDAIVEVMERSNLSPITREELKPDVFPNINLRARIEEYEEEVLAAAETAAAVAAAKAAKVAAADPLASEASV